VGRYGIHRKLEGWNICREGQFGDIKIDGTTALKCILMKNCVRMWSRFIWFMTGSSGRLL
jgi:hypothetical protein